MNPMHHTHLWCLVALLTLPLCVFANERDSVGQSVTQPETKDNVLKVDLSLLTHGETRNGGLPQGATEDKTNFIMGRERLVIDYERPGLETK
ncbi:MAG: hypothetical protein II449_05630, partial [Prevotella sp.]|nr:hypothetical protein [Prevotella sp.]